MTTQASKEAAKSKSRAQYLYLYVEQDYKIEQWIKDEAQKLAGDYKESGIYEGRKYFVRQSQDGSDKTYCIFWSTYVGYDGGWYVGTSLGGSYIAWCMVDQDMPPQKGWLMRGSLPLSSVNTSLKIKMESIIMHEVHVMEHCVLTPCRAGKEMAQCFAGTAISMGKGSTYGVEQLVDKPKATDCVEGMLKEMSCMIPLSHAFEHVVDAWYKAVFVDGFCYTASYQRTITGAEYNEQTGYNRLKYGGYTNAFSQELACNEPFAKALGDWLHISGTGTAENLRWARAHPVAAAMTEETGCHIDMHEALDHLIDYTHQVGNSRIDKNMKKGGFLACIENSCWGAILSVLFCGDHKRKAAIKAAAEVREEKPVIKERGLDLAEEQPVSSSLFWSSAPEAPPINQAELDEKNRKIQQMQMDLEAHRQRNDQLESEIQQIRQGEVLRDMKLSEIEASYALKFQELETTHRQKVAENDDLNNQLGFLKSRSAEYDVAYQKQASDYAMLQNELQSIKMNPPVVERSLPDEAQARRIEELEAAIQAERQNSNSSALKLSQLEASHNSKVQELQNMANTHSTRAQQLEQELMARQQDAQMQEIRLKEVDSVYQNRMQDIDAQYAAQIQALTAEANDANMQHDNLKQQFNMLAQQHDSEKSQLRQQYAYQLEEAEKGRANLEANVRELSMQLQAAQQQDVGAIQGMQDDFAQRQQALQVRHSIEVEQLQQAVADGNKRSLELESRLVSLQEASQGDDMRARQFELDNQARLQELDEAKMLIQQLQGATSMQDQQIKEMEQELNDAQISIQDLQADAMAKEQRMVEMEQVYEQRRQQAEAEINALSQQFAVQANAPNEDYMRAQMELQELRAAMDSERQQYAAQVAEFEQALATTTDEANVLRGQLATFQAGAETAEVAQPYSPQQPLSPVQPVVAQYAIPEPAMVVEAPPTYTMTSPSAIASPTYVIEGPSVVGETFMPTQQALLPGSAPMIVQEQVIETVPAQPMETYVMPSTAPTLKTDYRAAAPVQVTNRIGSSTKARVVPTSKEPRTAYASYEVGTSARPVTRTLPSTRVTSTAGPPVMSEPTKRWR